MSDKHLQQYVDEFSCRHGVRNRDTIDQIQCIAATTTGNQLMYRDLLAGNQ